MTHKNYFDFATIAEDFVTIMCTLTGGMQELVSTNQSEVYRATLTEVVPRIAVEIYAKDITQPTTNICKPNRTRENLKWSIRDSQYCIVQQIVSY